MKIHLRKRTGKLSPEKLKAGKKLMSSLYLAYQFPKQKVRYEWLRLYVFEFPKSFIEKEHNKQTWNLAESIKAKKLLDLQATTNGFISKEKGKISFLVYFKSIVDRKYNESKGNQGTWRSTYEHLKVYCDGIDYPLNQIDDLFLEGFKEYLQQNVMRRGKGQLQVNTGVSYFNKLRAAIKEAFIKKMIPENPCNRVKCIKAEDTQRQFLTFEELCLLASTECENPLLKKAFLFSALTGLRWCDVKSLTWQKIRYTEASGWSLHYTQQKTKHVDVLPISEQAINFLGERTGNESTEIFASLTYHTHMNSQLQTWIHNAGIDKKITFHCARHSFATLQLSLDTDIYTVSKLLGHKNLKTTQIYAKVIDKKKIDAVVKIPTLQTPQAC